MALTPIPTIYNGYAFRSRLEARWAYYFDLSGIRYEYEPEGFVLSDGQWYLPDFYLPDHQQHVEIKSSGDTASMRDVGPLPEIWTPSRRVAPDRNVLCMLDGVACGYEARPFAAFIVWDDHVRDIDGHHNALNTYGAILALLARDIWVFVQAAPGGVDSQLAELAEADWLSGRPAGWCDIVENLEDAKRKLAASHFDGRPKHFVAMVDAEKEGIGFRVFWGDPREAKTKANACARKVPLIKPHADAARQKRFEGGAA